MHATGKNINKNFDKKIRNTKFEQILLSKEVASVYYSKIWIESLCRGHRSNRRTEDLNMAVALDLQLAAAVGSSALMDFLLCSAASSRVI